MRSPHPVPLHRKWNQREAKSQRVHLPVPAKFQPLARPRIGSTCLRCAPVYFYCHALRPYPSAFDPQRMHVAPVAPLDVPADEPVVAPPFSARRSLQIQFHGAIGFEHLEPQPGFIGALVKPLTGTTQPPSMVQPTGLRDPLAHARQPLHIGGGCKTFRQPFGQ